MQSNRSHLRYLAALYRAYARVMFFGGISKKIQLL